MARFKRQPIELTLTALALLAAGLTVTLPAHALSSDRSQQIKVSADGFKTLGSGKTQLIGHVVIRQGSLVATATRGVAHTNAKHAVERVVLTGSPATVTQALDGGGKMNAHADRIDYHVGADSVELTGHAHLVQAGKGTFDGAHLSYNTHTGALSGQGGAGGRVHMVFAARQAPAAASSSHGQP